MQRPDAALLASLTELMDAVRGPGRARPWSEQDEHRLAFEVGRLVGRELVPGDASAPPVAVERVDGFVRRLAGGTLRAVPWDVGVTRLVLEEAHVPPSAFGESAWCLFVAGMVAGAASPRDPARIVVDHDRCRWLGDPRCEFVLAA